MNPTIMDLRDDFGLLIDAFLNLDKSEFINLLWKTFDEYPQAAVFFLCCMSVILCRNK